MLSQKFDNVEILFYIYNEDIQHTLQNKITVLVINNFGGILLIIIICYIQQAVTVNGHRIVHGDITAPKGGIIHVIDGTLCPVADQDIINTLRTCNKYDGFLTLADVTKLLDTMQDG